MDFLKGIELWPEELKLYDAVHLCKGSDKPVVPYVNPRYAYSLRKLRDEKNPGKRYRA